MKQLSLSGASTKISFIAGAAIEILKNKQYRPDVIIGISAGAILTVPLALGLYDEIAKVVKNFSLDDIFSIKPITTKGGFSIIGILRLLFGKSSFGEQEHLKDLLSKIITKELFEKYVSGDYPTIFIGAVDFKSGSRTYFEIKKLSYLDYLDAIMASSSIPGFVESVEIGGNYYYDGSVRDYIGSHWGFENLDITENISIYSRPENYNISDLLWKPKNIYTVLVRSIEIMQLEISKNDEALEKSLAEKKGINNKIIYTPFSLDSEMYKIDKILLDTWFQLGVSQASNISL